MEELTGLHWEKYRSNRLNEVRPVTVNIELRSLRAAMNRAMDWKFVPSNPFSRQKLCLVPESAPIFFSVEDFEQLVSAIRDDRFKRIMVFGILTGLRRSEITNLQWSDIDFTQKTLRVQSKADFKIKSGRRRIVALGDTAMQILTEIRSMAVGQAEYFFIRRQENKSKPPD